MSKSYFNVMNTRSHQLLMVSDSVNTDVFILADEQVQKYLY